MLVLDAISFEFFQFNVRRHFKGCKIRASTCCLYYVSCSSCCFEFLTDSREVLQCVVSVQDLVCTGALYPSGLMCSFGALSSALLVYRIWCVAGALCPSAFMYACGAVSNTLLVSRDWCEPWALYLSALMHVSETLLVCGISFRFGAPVVWLVQVFVTTPELYNIWSGMIFNLIFGILFPACPHLANALAKVLIWKVIPVPICIKRGAERQLPDDYSVIKI